MKKLAKAAPSFLAMVVSVLPILKCPFCWPAYVGLLSAMGIDFAGYSRYLFPATAFLLLAALLSIGWRASQRRGYRPFALAATAAFAILAGKFFLNMPWVFYLGTGMLAIASVWNIWPRNNSCPACTPEATRRMVKKS
ncbi:MAG: MerC family mercury resistance protein [Alphaproteobacteria bacterium]|nr:MerC family mercury resistance protein [Alphaproteobacteria bacterium]